MFSNRIPLFSLLGFKVYLDWSWLILFVLITWSLASGLFPAYYPNHSPWTYLAMGMASAVGLLFSIVLHELGHSLAARRYGVEMSGITLFLFGGVAEMRDEPSSPEAEFVIAIAGPIVSVILGVAGVAIGWWGLANSNWTALFGVLSYLGWLNLALVAFNIVPAFPLDGGRMLRALLWRAKHNLQWATRFTSRLGGGFGIVLIGLGLISIITGNFVGGLWLIVLGLFLRNAAQMSYRQLIVRRALEGEPVSRFMEPAVETVPPSTTVRDFVDNYVYKHHFKLYPVTDNGSLEGCVSTRMLQEFPKATWQEHTVKEVVQPCADNNSIDVNEDATVALDKMNRNGVSRLIVTENNRLRGIITLKDLMRFIALKVELEETP